MDEELMNIYESKATEIVVEEDTKEAVVAENPVTEVPTEETVYDVRVATAEPIVVDMSESMGWVSGDNRYHNSLLDIDQPDRHPITAITDLKETLDRIQSLKTVESNKFNVANYYKWKDAAYDTCGYFVSIDTEDSTIEICNGSDVFGVSVNDAGFVGGQDASVRRDVSYGLIATSGLVDVRCELDIKVGDCVVSNHNGYATKSGSKYGYKVLARENKDGVEYVVIMLGVQADVTNAIGVELKDVEQRVGVNESNIVSAINVANQAYNKATQCVDSNKEMSDKVDGALEVVDKITSDVENLGAQVSNSTLISAQAKAIAESAATSAESMKNEAIEKANEALAETAESRKYFDDLSTTMSGELDIVKTELTELEGGINDYKEEAKDTYVSRTDFTAFQDENTLAIAAVKKEASDTYATITSVANLETNTSEAVAGLRTEVQATYATQTALAQLKTDTTDAISASENKATETYATITDFTAFESKTNIAMARIEQKADANGAYIQSTVANLNKYSVGPSSQSDGFTSEQAESVLAVGMIYVPTETHTEKSPANRTFTKQYYYTWDGTKWVTSSSVAVMFSDSYQIGGANAPYWYIPGGSDVTNNGITYNSHTLYKYESYVDEDGTTCNHWVAVATLEGNSQNRAVSQIRQDANSIELSVTTLDDKYAGTKMWVDNNKSAIQDTVTWKSENAESITTFMQEAGDNFASAAQVAKIVDKDGNVIESSIVTAVNNNASSIYLSADNINFEGSQFSSTMSSTYATKDETNTAKNDAIASSNSSTDEKLKNYSTTKQTQSLIDQKADGITLSVSQTYSTKGETNTAKNDAITSSNSSTDEKLKNYSTTTQTQSLIDQKADSIALSVSQTYSTKDETNTAKNDAINTANNSTDEKLKNYSTTTQTQSLINQKADSITASVSSTYAKTTDVDGAISEVEAKIALEIKDDNGKKYAYLNANADKIKFDATKTIEIDATNFQIDSDGNINAKSGYIGGWTIDSTGLLNGNIGMTTKGDLVDTNDGNMWSKCFFVENSFYVLENGYLYANNANISGNINATGGYIGGWQIVDGNLIATETTDNDGDGIDESVNMILISPSAIALNDTYLFSDGRIKVGSSFSVSADGDITAQSGYIGGWTIDGDKLTGKDNENRTITLTPNYIKIGNNYPFSWYDIELAVVHAAAEGL